MTTFIKAKRGNNVLLVLVHYPCQMMTYQFNSTNGSELLNAGKFNVYTISPSKRYYINKQ